MGGAEPGRWRRRYLQLRCEAGRLVWCNRAPQDHQRRHPPTVEAEIFVELSAEDLRWYDFGSSLKGGTVADAVSSDSVEIPDKAIFMRLKAGRSTGQAVTVDVDLSIRDSLG